MRSRAVITGGAGFIGSHLAEALLAEGLARTADWFRDNVQGSPR